MVLIELPIRLNDRAAVKTYEVDRDLVALGFEGARALARQQWLAYCQLQPRL